MSVLRSKTWIKIPDNISISELMLDNVSGTPDDKIIYEEAFSGKTATYGGFRQDVKRAAHWLKTSLQLQKSQVVAVLAPSCIDYVLAVHSVWWAGGVVSLINYSLHESEIAYAFDLVEPSLIITHGTLFEKVKNGLRLCSQQHSAQVLTFGDPHPASRAFPSHLPPHSAELEVYNLQGGNPRKELAAILLSSGTTGRPKAVMLSHYNLVAAIYQLRSDNPTNWRGSQREIFFPPLSHVYALYVCMTGACWLGAYVCLMPRFVLEDFCRLMQDRRATLARLVPPIAKLLATNPLVRKYTYSDLEYFSCSAAPLNADTAGKLRAAFPGVALCQTYGATELSGPCVQSGVRDKDLALSAAGTLISNIEMRFLSVDDSSTDTKSPGEILVRGPNVMMGYKDNEEANASATFEGDWYRTGDLGYIDKKGFLVVYDRIKDIIKYNGFQVAPIELEEILVQHPLVDEAAICGIWNDDQSTELVRAYVVLKGVKRRAPDDLLSLERDISHFVAGRVAHYKQLKGGIVFLDALPKNPTGKVLRRVLRMEGKKQPRSSKL